MAKLPLHGIRVLILEDDFWQAEDSRDRLIEAGAEVVAMTGSISAATAFASVQQIDIGLLDINLAGSRSFDFARALLKLDTPVLFLTGYEPDLLPLDLADVPTLTKPAVWPVIIAQLARMVSGLGPLAADADAPHS